MFNLIAISDIGVLLAKIHTQNPQLIPYFEFDPNFVGAQLKTIKGAVLMQISVWEHTEHAQREIDNFHQKLALYYSLNEEGH